jgi:hypothetical protein
MVGKFGWLPISAAPQMIGGFHWRRQKCMGLHGGNCAIGAICGHPTFVTMEMEPRVLELRGEDVYQVAHAYGTNGIITAPCEIPLAQATIG